MQHTDTQTVLIIGSGLGGLLTGALLSRTGHRVTVLEKMPGAGGCLQNFVHHGMTFETGFHTLGGFCPGSAPVRLFKAAGIWDDIAPHIVPLDADGFDEVRMHGRRYLLPTGRERFTEALCGFFPEERAGIEAYMEEIYRLCDLIPSYRLQPVTPGAMPGGGAAPERSARDCIAQFTGNPELRDLLAWNNTLYGGDALTPDFVAALITRMYIEGAVRFRGGTQCIADALRKVVEQHGGQVLTGREVVGAETEGRRVTALRTSDGMCHRAGWYISSLHPAATAALLPEGALPKAYRRRLCSLRNSCSLFTLFIEFKPGSFPYLNRNIFLYRPGFSVWETNRYAPDSFPHGMLVLTPPDEGGGRFARRMTVHCIMPQEAVLPWAGTRHGARPAGYEEFKSKCTAQVFAALRTIFPEIDGAVRHHFAATPLTLQDYLSLYDAAVYGTVHDYREVYVSLLPVRTKMQNLLLTGQSVFLHGICGVPVTAFQTCEAVAGSEALGRLLAGTA